MSFALDICVNKKAPLTHSLHWSLSPYPPQEHHPYFFSKPRLRSPNYPGPLFYAIHPPPHPAPPTPPTPKNIGFSCIPSKNRIFQ